MPTDPGNQRLADAVAGQPRIPVGETHFTVTDDEWRVADDQVEVVIGDRLVQRALPQVPLLAVQPGGGAGQRQSPRVGISGHHRLRMTRQVQGLNATTGADVECPLDRQPDDAASQRDRRGTEAQHMVPADRAGSGVRVQVGDQQVLIAICGVGPDVQGGPDGVVMSLEDPLGQCSIDAGGR